MKSPLIGEDCERNQYWVFKEDLSRIYVKNPFLNTWSIYDDELAINQLEASLCFKGIRERKLQEQIKKLKGKLKYKKKKEASQVNMEVEEEKAGEEQV